MRSAKYTLKSTLGSAIILFCLFSRIIVHEGSEDVLGEKKTTLTDSNEIKAVNKQINTPQEEFGRLRKEIQYRRSYERSVEREFVHCVVGDG